MEQAHTQITKVRAVTKPNFPRRLSMLPLSALFMVCASDANSQAAPQTPPTRSMALPGLRQAQ